MKILHFTHCFFPVYGGTTTRLYNLLTDGINKHYLYVPQAPSTYIPDNIGILKNEENFGNITIRRCKLFEKFNFRINMFRYIVNSNRLVNFIKEEKFNIVHGHNPLEFAIAAMRYAKEQNIPFIYESHGLVTDTFAIEKRQYVSKAVYSSIQKLFKLKEKRIYDCADAIVTQTKAMKQRIINMFNIDADKIKIIPNGVDENKFDPANWHQKGDELKKERNWDGKIIFMYSGFLDDVNGIEFFLNGIKELPEDIKQEVKVVILGRGPLQKYVEDISRQESDSIEYLGLVNYNDMPVYYSACDVFVIPRPSTPPAENLMPMKLLEAMAMGKIVLGSDVGGITEVLANNKNGIVFNNGNKEHLLKKMSYIVKNIGNMNNIRKQARKRVIEKYGWGKSRERLQDIYKAVCRDIHR